MSNSSFSFQTSVGLFLLGHTTCVSVFHFFFYLQAGSSYGSGATATEPLIVGSSGRLPSGERLSNSAS